MYECLFNRGVCYYALGENEKALVDFQNVMDNSPEESLVASAKELVSALKSAK